MTLRDPIDEQKNLNEVKRYYRVTRLFYKYFWHGKTDAVHYGCFDEKASTLKEALIRTIEKTAEAVDVKDDQKIIDLGSGVGSAVFWLAEQTSAHVTGITVSEAQHKKALKTQKKRQLGEKTQFVCGDYFKTPFEDKSFDRAISIEAACHAHHRIDAFTAELYRILKPGAKVAITDGYRGANSLSEYDDKQLRIFEEGVSVGHFITPYNFMESLKRQGFKNIQFHDWSVHILPSAECMYQKIARWRPVVNLLKKLHLLPSILVKNHAAGEAQLYLAKEGVVVYGCITAEK